MLMNIDDWFLNRILIGSLYGFIGVILSPKVTPKFAPYDIFKKKKGYFIRNVCRKTIDMIFEAFAVVIGTGRATSLHAG